MAVAVSLQKNANFCLKTSFCVLKKVSCQME